MNTSTRVLLGVGLILVLVIAIAGAALAQGPLPWGGYLGSGMMGNWNGPQDSPWGPGGSVSCGTGGGMMGGQGWGPGVTAPNQCPMWGATIPAGEPLTLDEAEAIAGQTLASYGNPDLEIAEIMQFSRNFYVEIRETSTGIGAMELLIHPITGAVHPEPGPNMMWNAKYGHMGQGGMMGRGMMGGFRLPSGDMTLSANEAIAAAQAWLDANLPGVMAGDEAESFYGYYTLHTLADGEISGMLSVNGATGQVWYHNWHGAFVDMTGEHEE